MLVGNDPPLSAEKLFQKCTWNPHLFPPTVAFGCFFVMATLTQRLPVASIPEQAGIGFVRNNVINNCGDSRNSSFAAFNAQRIRPQEFFASSAPFGTISS
jgi:hypothetical protein